MRRAGERRILVGREPVEHQPRRFFERVRSLGEPFRRRAEACAAAAGDVARHLPDLSNLVADGFAVGQRQLALHEIDRVDAVRAFVDRRDAGIAHVLGRPGLLDESHAAMDLDADRRRLVADVGRERLGDGGEQRRAVGGGRSFGLGRGVVGKVERNAGQVADPARGVDVGLHRHQHALHVGTLDDRGHAVAAFGAAALPALAGVANAC